MNFIDLQRACASVIDDPGYATTLGDAINAAVMSISGGIRMPDRSLTPPLPDLYAIDWVDTDPEDPFVDLPEDYQREVVLVFSETQQREVYLAKSHIQFIRRYPSLSQVGSVEAVSVKGSKLYYQGIPADTQPLVIHYYRKPVAMELDEDLPDGIPEHLHQIIVHLVAWRIFDEIEDGIDGHKANTMYHQRRFYELMDDLSAFSGIDGRPAFITDEYGVDNAF